MTGRVERRGSVHALRVFRAIDADAALLEGLADAVVDAVGWVAAEEVVVAIGTNAVVVTAVAVVGAEIAAPADDAGNLFVTTSTGVQVFDPAGEPWGTIVVPDGRAPANCAFGGEDAHTLYVTARQALYEVRLMRPGLY